MMYVRFSKRNFRKTDALSALKCGLFTFPFDVICLKNGSFWGVSCPLKSVVIYLVYLISNSSYFSIKALLQNVAVTQKLA